MNENEANEWAASLTDEQRQHLGLFTSRARSEGMSAGVAQADKKTTMTKWLIPLAVFGVPAGMLIQRYLIVLG